MFLELRDGTGVPSVLQTVLAPPLSQTVDAVQLHTEAAVVVYGTLKVDERAKHSGGMELQADYWQVIGVSAGEMDQRINEHTHVDVLADQRHLQIRQLGPSYILKIRSHALQVSSPFRYRCRCAGVLCAFVHFPRRACAVCFFSASAITSSRRASSR